MVLRGEYASTEELNRFQSEALVISRLQHPNIVQIYAVGAHNGNPFFALEYCRGGNLAQQLSVTNRMDPKAGARLVSTLARAVHTAHQSGIVHRDLKPSNILLTEDNTPKIADFGLAKQLDRMLERTQSGTVVGTPNYMPPEQANGHIRAVGVRSDVYALGAILYEALTGQPPYNAPTAWETLHKVCKEELVPPRMLRPEIQDDLQAVILQCMEKDPEGRYATAKDLADDLDRWLCGDPVSVQRRNVLYRLKKRYRKHRGKVVGGMIALILLLLFWICLADAGIGVPGSAQVQRWLDSQEISVFRPVAPEAKIRAEAVTHRRILLQHLLKMSDSREGWFARPSEAPDPWTQMQGTVALFSCPDQDHSHDAICIQALDRMFEPNGMFPPFVTGYGWPHSEDTYISAEPLAWSFLGIVKILARLDRQADVERTLLLQRLAQVQSALDNYRSRNRTSGKFIGGWNIFARQVEPEKANLYVTLLMCQGLLDLTQADLPWHDSRALRDSLLQESLTWLLQEFDGKGWSNPSTVEKQFNDGITLQVLTVLLRAEAAGHRVLPDPILEQISRLLLESSNWELDHKSPAVLIFIPIRNDVGDLIPRAQRIMRPVWYAWAVHCSACWLQRCKRMNASHDEIVRTRRVLDRLILKLGKGAVEESMHGYTYVSAETLIGLSAIELPE
jgi:serine/threonine protein kinase